jgi:1,4-alpha-glucan branching enzyme
VSDVWRARVLRDVARARAVRRARTLVVAAAAVLCVVSATIALQHRGASRRVAAVDAESVRFTLVAPAARRVALVGDFDAWNARGRPMRRSPDGRTWQVDIPLAPGRHTFAYLVDGTLRVDPAAARAVEDDFGVPSSVVVVSDRRLQ